MVLKSTTWKEWDFLVYRKVQFAGLTTRFVAFTF